MLVLLLMKIYPDFSEITQIKMCLCIARVFDDHRSCQKLINYITNIKAISKQYYWIQKLPVLQRLFIPNFCKRNRCLEENPVFLFLSKKQIMKKKNSPQVCKQSFRLSTVPNLKLKIKRFILIFFGHMVVDMEKNRIEYILLPNHRAHMRHH